MLQRQIVVKGLGKQIGIDDPAYTKYDITNFHSIPGCSYLSMLPYTGPDNHHSGHCITTTKLLGRCI